MENIFVPDQHSNIASDKIENGLNYTYTIGHGVWCVKDFLGVWAAARSHLDTDKSIELPVMQISALCAALAIPDRTPWFIWKF